MRQITISLTADEALMIVKALGTYQNRIGQHANWAERKRIPLLEQQAAEAESEQDLNIIHSKIEWTRCYIASSIEMGVECNRLKERIKQEAGIADQKPKERYGD